MSRIDLADRVIVNLAFQPEEKVLRAESGVIMIFRGKIERTPQRLVGISTGFEGWTIEPNGALILTNRRIFFAKEGRKYLLLRVPKILLETPISMIYSVGIAEGRVRELVIALETGTWRKNRFYFRVRDPDSWARIITELISSRIKNERK